MQSKRGKLKRKRQRPRRSRKRGMSTSDTERAGALPVALRYVDAAQLEEMRPGEIILLEESESLQSQVEPVFCAVLACPLCGTRGLITRAQHLGIVPVICSSDRCSCRLRIVERSRIVILPAS